MTLLELQVTQVQDKWHMIELPPLYNITKWLVSTSRKLDRRKFLQSVNILAILHHSYSFRVHPDIFLVFCPGIRLFQGYLVFKRPNLYQNRLTLVPPKWHLEEEGEDDGYANQKMCAIFSRSIGLPMLYLSKATLTFRAFEWVEAFEKVALLYLKLNFWAVKSKKSNVKTEKVSQKNRNISGQNVHLIKFFKRCDS